MVNIPLPHGTGNVGYAYTYDALVEPIIAEYEPDLLLVSNGFDPSIRSDRAELGHETGIQRDGGRTRQLADDYSNGSLGVVLEGGYNVSHLSFATVGVFEGLLGVETGISDPHDFEEHANENISTVKEWVQNTQLALADYWTVAELKADIER